MKAIYFLLTKRLREIVVQFVMELVSIYKSWHK